jgi:hypothetical protein
MIDRGRKSWLDGRGARLAAIAVAAVAAGILGYLNRDAFITPERKLSPQEAAFERCMAERSAGIDEMVRQQAITADQEALFRQRAEDLCRAQAASEQPPPVGLPLPLPEQ